jgi:hypothetical protein
MRSRNFGDNLKNLLSQIMEETESNELLEAASPDEKEEWETKKDVIKKFLKDQDLIIEKEPLQLGYKEFEVRAKEGSGHRIEVRDRIFNRLPSELKKWKPQKAWGGRWRSKKAPNIEFQDEWRIVFAPTVGQKKIKAEDYEDAICAKWNDKFNHSYNFKYNEILDSNAAKIVEKLAKEIGTKATAEPFGRHKMPDVSEFWHEHTNYPNRTPKTDLIISNYDISLKMGEKAQLASPKIINAEGEALFFHAVEKSNLEKKIVDKFRDWFSFDEEGISKLGASTSEIIAKGEEYFKVNQRAFTEDIQEVVRQNKDFAYYFVDEAMSGERKFEGVSGAQDAVANYILVCEYDGSAIVLHKIEESYVREVADQVEIYAAWKSARGAKYATFRISQTTKLGEAITVADVLNSFDINDLGDIELTLEDILQYAENIGAIELYDLDEGLKDVVKTIGETLKKIAKKGLDKLLDLFGISLSRITVTNLENVSFW